MKWLFGHQWHWQLLNPHSCVYRVSLLWAHVEWVRKILRTASASSHLTLHIPLYISLLLLYTVIMMTHKEEGVLGFTVLTCTHLGYYNLVK
jgi:hypothetical protein